LSFRGKTRILLVSESDFTVRVLPLEPILTSWDMTKFPCQFPLSMPACVRILRRKQSSYENHCEFSLLNSHFSVVIWHPCSASAPINEGISGWWPVQAGPHQPPAASAQAADRGAAKKARQKPPQSIRRNIGQYKPVQVSTSEYNQ